MSLAIALTATSLTGCLKTRAQLKDDPDDREVASKPVPAQVQDVQPKGEYVIDEIKSEITRLTGRVEDLERTAHQQQKAANDPKEKEEVQQLHRRIEELERAQAEMLEALKKLQTSAPAAAENTDAFEKGKASLKAGNLEAAVESFTSYLKYPKAKNAEEATFLRGEAYFGLKQHKKAIIDFSKFPEKFTKSKRLPAALLKIGQSFEALGMKEDAKGFYQELVDKFPKAPEAKKAKAKLK